MSMILLAAVLVLGDAVADTLDDVRARGFLRVGVNGELPGFGMPDEQGVWHGLDVDTARAVAAAIFADAQRVEFLPLSATNRVAALQEGDIDLLCLNTTRTLSRESVQRINFVQVNYYDGQGFMVPRTSGIRSAKQLDGATLCMLPGTTTAVNVEEYFRANGMSMTALSSESEAALGEALFTGRCDCLTSDTSQLAGTRAIAPNPADYIILPEVISKEPLAPAVRHGDDRWYDIVNFCVLALIAAEELGITSENADVMLHSSRDPRVQRFLGVLPGNGSALGLDERWAYHIIKSVGNYAEIFERNVGRDSPLGLERGLNNLWLRGGLMYAPPFK